MQTVVFLKDETINTNSDLTIFFLLNRIELKSKYIDDDLMLIDYLKMIFCVFKKIYFNLNVLIVFFILYFVFCFLINSIYFNFEYIWLYLKKSCIILLVLLKF